MINFIKNLFKIGPAVNYLDLVQNGAVLLDVRFANEFKSGHIKGAKNTPLDQLLQHVAKIDKNSVIITCCASGMRSSVAKNSLKSNGFKNVHNGGGWNSLQSKLKG
ncbi:rhodanese-like domain-containing protein [Flavobacterium algicola]|uniref:rhodanese-like domain-containing protein n=1 Tax=Flavobacterium algicola TaxID=556529 RepID=UPI001EFD2580|nr:rhodanese-like domain-containing protein [Flavobacterium algicola]MCG9793398.1 rhodanese-like domain-containing protein [Flavobacterium algicola]